MLVLFETRPGDARLSEDYLRRRDCVDQHGELSSIRYEPIAAAGDRTAYSAALNAVSRAWMRQKSRL